MSGSRRRSQRQQERLRRPLLFFPKKKRRQGWRQRQSQCYSRRADWRRRQDRWQQTMRGGGKLGKPTHLRRNLRRNLRRMMGRCATFFFARYEGVPRALHGVPLIPLQPALQTRRSRFLRAAVAPNRRYERRFPGHERERPCGLQRGALISITCPRLQAMDVPLCVWMYVEASKLLPPGAHGHPYWNEFQYFRMHWTEKQY